MGNIIERAYELGRTGQCRSISELENRLKREGYSAVQEHLVGLGLRREMRAIFADVRARKQLAT